MTAASGAGREEVRADFWQDYADGHPDAGAYVAASGADQPTKDQSPHRGNDGGSDRGETSRAGGTAIVADQPTLAVNVRHVLAARVRCAGDRALGRTTPPWIVRLAATKPSTGGET